MLKQNHINQFVSRAQERCSSSKKDLNLYQGLKSQQKRLKSKEWTRKQLVKYAAFIEKNRWKMENIPLYELWNDFKLMAKFIFTKNYRQCKLKHQRFLQNFRTVQRILMKLFEEIDDFEECLNVEKRQLLKFQENNFRGATEQQIKNNIYEFYGLNPIDMKALHQTNIYYDNKETNLPPQCFLQNTNLFQFPQQKLTNPQFLARQWKECYYYFSMWVEKCNKLMFHQLS